MILLLRDFKNLKRKQKVTSEKKKSSLPEEHISVHRARTKSKLYEKSKASPLGQRKRHPDLAKSAFKIRRAAHQYLCNHILLQFGNSVSDSATTDMWGQSRKPKIEGVKTEFVYADGAKDDVQLSGDWNDWKAIQMFHEGGGMWSVVTPVPPGPHEFKFIVDGEWKHSNRHPTVGIDETSLNNVRCVLPQPDLDGTGKASAVPRASGVRPSNAQRASKASRESRANQGSRFSRSSRAPRDSKSRESRSSSARKTLAGFFK